MTCAIIRNNGTSEDSECELSKRYQQTVNGILLKVAVPSE